MENSIDSQWIDAVLKDYFSQRKYERLPPELQNLPFEEKRRLYVVNYYQTNKERIVNRKKKVYSEHLERERKKNRDHYHKHGDEYRKKQRENYHYKKCCKEQLEMLNNLMDLMEFKN